MARKVTKAEKLERVDAVIDLLLQSVGRRGILQYFANKGWSASARTVDWYIAEARDELVELSRHRREDEFALAREQLGMLLMRALAKGDLRTARLVRKDLTELLGLVAEPVHRFAFAQASEEQPAPAIPLERLTDDERETYFDLFEKLIGEEAGQPSGNDEPKGEADDRLILPD